MNPTTPTIGDGTRILHFLVDTILIAFIAYSIYGWWNFHVMYWNYTPIQYGAFFLLPCGLMYFYLNGFF